MIVAREGGAEIRVDDAAFIALVDRATEGAASSFIATVRPVLERIRGDAMAKWPVRSGVSKAAFEIRSAVTPTEIRVALVNEAQGKGKRGGWGYYAYKIRYSIWTGVDVNARIEEAASRANSPEAADNIRAFMRSKMKRKHGSVAPSEEVAGKQPWLLWVRKPAKAALPELLPQLQTSMNRLAGGSDGGS